MTEKYIKNPFTEQKNNTKEHILIIAAEESATDKTKLSAREKCVSFLSLMGLFTGNFSLFKRQITRLEIRWDKSKIYPAAVDFKMPRPATETMNAGPAFMQKLSIFEAFSRLILPVLTLSLKSFAPMG